MNKRSMLLAAVGLAVLTGCANNKVMEDRKYVPAKDENTIAETKKIDDIGMTPAVSEDPKNTDEKKAVSVPAPADAPAAPVRFAPMEGVKSSGGVSSAPRKAGKRSGRAVAKGGEYIVRRGDYLGKIARQHGVSVKDLMAANNMTEKDVKRLHVGRKLVIPGGKGAKAAVKSKRAAAKTAAPAVAKGGVYIVRPGDFPARIARKHGVKVADLLKANNMTMASSRSLRIGQKLVIPGAAGSAAAAEKPAEVVPVVNADAPAAADKPADAPGAAEVKEADKLADDLEKTVANAKSGTQKTADSADPSSVATDIHEVTADIPLRDLAVKFNTTEENLRSLNDNFQGDVVKKGTYFFVPLKK